MNVLASFLRAVDALMNEVAGDDSILSILKALGLVDAVCALKESAGPRA